MGTKNLPANPLQALIAGVAKTTPARTGEVAKYERRIANPSAPVVLILDCSSSMGEFAGSRQRIEILKEALAQVLPGFPGARLVVFSSLASEITRPADLPGPSGGTALHLALDLATSIRPGRTLVISDGEPDSEQAALEAAERLSGRIDTIFCGSDQDTRGKDFLARLARAGCGTYVRCDLAGSGPAGSPSRLAIAARQVLGLTDQRGKK